MARNGKRAPPREGDDAHSNLAPEGPFSERLRSGDAPGGTVPVRGPDGPWTRWPQRTTTWTVSTTQGCSGTCTPSATTAMTRCSPGATSVKV